MQTITSNFRLIMLALIVSFCMFGTLNAQTPADDPGIGGPGVGAAPAGDGSPIVPFDTNLSLILLSAGIFYGTRKIKVLSVSK